MLDIKFDNSSRCGTRDKASPRELNWPFRAFTSRISKEEIVFSQQAEHDRFRAFFAK